MRHTVYIFLTLFSFLFLSEIYAFDKGEMLPVRVIIQKVSELNEDGANEYIGEVEAIDVYDLDAMVAGIITGIFCVEGSIVNKGDLILELEDIPYKAAYLISKAQYAQAQADLEYCRKNYERIKHLSERNALSKAELDEALRKIEYSKAKILEMEGILMDAEYQLRHTKIYSPVTGIIGYINQSIGNYITPSTPTLATVQSIDPVYVKFPISMRDFLDIFKTRKMIFNKKLNISLKLQNDEIYSYKGKIAIVDNVADTNTGTIFIWCEFPNPDYTLVPGGFVSVLLSEDNSKKIPAVSLKSVMRDKDGTFVYVVDKDNKVERRDIVVGKTAPGGMVIVKNGLTADETVILEGSSKVQPGQSVKPELENNLE